MDDITMRVATLMLAGGVVEHDDGSATIRPEHDTGFLSFGKIPADIVEDAKAFVCGVTGAMQR